MHFYCPQSDEIVISVRVCGWELLWMTRACCCHRVVHTHRSGTHLLPGCAPISMRRLIQTRHAHNDHTTHRHAHAIWLVGGYAYTRQQRHNDAAAAATSKNRWAILHREPKESEGVLGSEPVIVYTAWTCEAYTIPSALRSFIYVLTHRHTWWEAHARWMWSRRKIYNARSNMGMLYGMKSAAQSGSKQHMYMSLPHSVWAEMPMPLYKQTLNA